MSTNVKFDLAKMTPEAQNVWLDVYGLGYQHGIERGRHLERADDEARWAWMREQIRGLATTPDYSELARRRGQHDRAEAQERLLTERGIR